MSTHLRPYLYPVALETKRPFEGNRPAPALAAGCDSQGGADVLHRRSQRPISQGAAIAVGLELDRDKKEDLGHRLSSSAREDFQHPIRSAF